MLVILFLIALFSAALICAHIGDKRVLKSKAEPPPTATCPSIEEMKIHAGEVIVYHPQQLEQAIIAATKDNLDLVLHAHALGRAYRVEGFTGNIHLHGARLEGSNLASVVVQSGEACLSASFLILHGKDSLGTLKDNGLIIAKGGSHAIASGEGVKAEAYDNSYLSLYKGAQASAFDSSMATAQDPTTLLRAYNASHGTSSLGALVIYFDQSTGFTSQSGRWQIQDNASVWIQQEGPFYGKPGTLLFSPNDQIVWRIIATKRITGDCQPYLLLQKLDLRDETIQEEAKMVSLKEVRQCLSSYKWILVRQNLPQTQPL